MNNFFIKAHDFIYNRAPAYKGLHKEITQLVGEHGTDLNLLEAPTTTGNLSAMLQAIHRVTTIDISTESLNAATNKNSKVHTVIFDAYKEFPLPDESFDGVISTHLLYFLRDKKNILAEYNRVLKSGGFFIITEFNGYKSFRETLSASTNSKGIRLWKTADIILNFLNRVSPAQYLSLGVLTKLLENHGFRITARKKTFGNLSNTIVAQKK